MSKEQQEGRLLYVHREFRLFGVTYMVGDTFDRYLVPINQRKFEAMKREGDLGEKPPGAAKLADAAAAHEAGQEPANRSAPIDNGPGTAGNPAKATMNNTGGGWYEVTIEGRAGEPERIKGLAKAKAWIVAQGAVLVE